MQASLPPQQPDSRDRVLSPAPLPASHPSRCRKRLPAERQSPAILSLLSVYVAQIEMCSEVSRVARNLLFICLCRFFQFPSYARIVVGGDGQLFSLAGMLAQLKRLREIFVGAS